MAFAYEKRHVKMLALWIRLSNIPEMHKKKLCMDMIPLMLQDNPTINYRQFYTMAVGETYKGINYDKV